MECACSVDVDIDDVDKASATWCEIKKARVSHKCEECNKVISIGETYEHYTGIYDGSFFKHKTCKDCLSIRDVFFYNGYYFGAILEYFYEFINENNGQISEKCLSSLTPLARELACEHIQEIWTEHCLENPTEQAFRLERMVKKMRYRNGWMMERASEMLAMDESIFNAIENAIRKAGPPSK